ncbi:hypothetical protein [Spiroplasma endosymbiont of Glossina fuscipes fuscipes]|uniref:hypothetical protein n=1 Tax=Spiroplasma endosymbiont of Glossina fuscipes fuscipes TaxID=2004463 RepID=UPI003C750BAF
MNKRYLLVIKQAYSIDTLSFYTKKEAEINSKNYNLYGNKVVILDLEDKNIEWLCEKGCE